MVVVDGNDGNSIDALGQNFIMTPQIKGALKAVSGVVDVLDL